MSTTTVRDYNETTQAPGSTAPAAGGLVDPLAACQLSDALHDPLVDPLLATSVDSQLGSAAGAVQMDGGQTFDRRNDSFDWEGDLPGEGQVIGDDPSAASCREEAQRQFEECVAPLNDNDMGEMPGSNERGFRHLGCMLRHMWDNWMCGE